jgi:hypothetical protein
MVTRLDDEVIASNMETVKAMVAGWSETRRKAVAKMLSGVVGEEFFTAPASMRTEYHNCFPGGLCDHSLRVTLNLMNLTGLWAPGRWTNETLEFVGLFHDLGKVGDGERPYYNILYEANRECVYMPTSERGLFVLQKFGVTVTDEEYLAIRLNDGMYDETNKRYAMKEPDLAVLVHMADRWACAQEKR